MKRIILIILFFISTKIFAQETKPSPLTISGYAEAYYTYDFNRPDDHLRAPFIYSHNRTNEVNLNLGLIKAAYVTDNIRANVAIAAGTYMNANYAAEPGTLKNIYEANIGVRLSSKSNLWLDAGIMPSHIGWETAIGKDNWTLSRSLAAENSPYFETGAKIGYTSKEGQWYLSAMVLNGWQRIQQPDDNSTPSFGTQIVYKPSSGVTLNSSTFIGNDKADSLRRMRYFHDFYGIFQLAKRFAATAGFDIGAEQQSKGSGKLNTWYTPVVIVKYSATPKINLALRAEYYADKDGVIISAGTPNGFKTWGYSADFDYSITSNLLWRMEVRNLDSQDQVFSKTGPDLTSNSTAVTTSLAFSF